MMRQFEAVIEREVRAARMYLRYHESYPSSLLALSARLLQLHGWRFNHE